MKLRSVRLAPRVPPHVERLADGALVLGCGEPLGPMVTRYTEKLAHWAATAPERTFLAQRTADGKDWERLTWGDAWAKVQRIAQALLDRGLGQERTLVILSGNGIDHALVALAALHVGVAYSPVSVGYSTVSRDFAKLRHCLGIMKPGLVYATCGNEFGAAIEAAVPPEVEVACMRNPVARARSSTLEQLLDTQPTAAVEAAAQRVTPQDVGRILFTSGSTALPKGATNTHRVLAAGMQQLAQVWPFIMDEAPVLCDWLPWNHTFGGNLMLGVVMQGGGTLYIDDGRPQPGLIERTVANLREVRPTIFVSVPTGYEMLLPYLREDEHFRTQFFSRMAMLYYSAASLPDPVNQAYRELAMRTTGFRIFTTSGYGSTETGPLATICTWDTPRMGVIGLPVPGVTAKLIPNAGRLEIRVKGPGIVPGYFRQPELTAKGFDGEGWYCLGDALRFVDPDDVNEGLLYDGRIGEDFKLTTGTWVGVGPLRTRAMGILTPLAANVLVCGHDRGEVGVLVFPEIEFCRRIAVLPPDAKRDEVLDSPRLHQELQRRVDALAAEGTSSSNRIVRMRMAYEPTADVEITDKRTLSTNVVLARRRDEIDDLYSERPARPVFLATARARGST